jgi:hypothetical protein
MSGTTFGDLTLYLYNIKEKNNEKSIFYFLIMSRMVIIDVK